MMSLIIFLLLSVPRTCSGRISGNVRESVAGRRLAAKPTKKPVSKPTRKPTKKPLTKNPSRKPSRKPSRRPTEKPRSPTRNPSRQPTSTKTSKPTTTSTKKGFVYGLSETNHTSKVLSVKPNWYYTWNRNGNSNLTIPFVPMSWGKGSLPSLNYSTLLGFNEPDKGSQSNLTVEQALALWPNLVNHSSRLGSPATAGNPTTSGSWLEQFMAASPKVDFIAVHWYAPPNATTFLKFIDTIYSKFQKPIWVTEFAAADWNDKYPGGYPLDRVKTFMKDACAGLDNRTFVERYTWKTRTTSDVNMGTSAIFNDDSSLTELGQIYAAI